MKVAFHFDAFHSSLSSYYGKDLEELMFSIILKYRNLSLSSKVLTGHLLLHNLAHKIEKTGKNQQVFTFNKKNYIELISLWLQPENIVWSSIISSRLIKTLNDKIYIICFETIEMQLVKYINDKLEDNCKAYIGGIEVDEAFDIHWYLYSYYISPRYRINNKTASVFWNGISEDSKDENKIFWLTQLGFSNVDFESLNGRYTILDEYHDFEHARRVAEWKKHCGNLLAFIADDVAHKLGDAAPDLGNKLWAMLKTFNQAETDEEFAQVTASCRRIVEYVSDQLFPPIDEEKEGRKLGTKQYRNRLLAFADNAKKSDTNIDLIWVSTKTLSEQMEKLADLANKGVHAEVYRGEARRCLLRTIMLLDDIISLKVGAFEIKTKLNLDDFLKHVFEE